MKQLFIKSGMADCCPIMARIICHQMTDNQDYLVRFVENALSLSRTRGETAISKQTWQDTDAAFDWPQSITTAAFWKR